MDFDLTENFEFKMSKKKKENWNIIEKIEKWDKNWTKLKIGQNGQNCDIMDFNLIENFESIMSKKN